MNQYIGHDSQVYGVEEHRLVGGKGDGMRLLQVRNGKGLDFTVVVDRCADIYRLSFKGMNMGYISPSGYVAPAYYDKDGDGFLKSFTAGFLTTCGLEGAGAPCEDDGEAVPMHGTISNTPAEMVCWEETEEGLVIHAIMKDERIFAHKFVMYRDIVCSLKENKLMIRDKIVNRGDTAYPLMLLYHMNMGYPLLSEKAILNIPSEDVVARDARAAEDLDTWNKILTPQVNFQEQCYFHKFSDKGVAELYNPDINMGVQIKFDSKQLPFFTQWKMMGVRDYVMGLEPGNCHPNGRDKMRQEGNLQILQPNESACFEVEIVMLEGRGVRG